MKKILLVIFLFLLVVGIAGCGKHKKHKKKKNRIACTTLYEVNVSVKYTVIPHAGLSEEMWSTLMIT